MADISQINRQQRRAQRPTGVGACAIEGAAARASLGRLAVCKAWPNTHTQRAATLSRGRLWNTRARRRRLFHIHSAAASNVSPGARRSRVHMDKSTMLSYGVPEVGKSGFQATLASATGKEPSASGADERGASSDDPLGDFIAFDNAAPSLLRPADAHGEQEQQQEEQQAERQQMPSAWCDSRRYSGSLPLLVLHEELLDFWQAFQPTGDGKESGATLFDAWRRWCSLSGPAAACTRSGRTRPAFTCRRATST